MFEFFSSDCCDECCRSCTRRAVCVSGIILSGLIFSAVTMLLVLAFSPKQPPITRDCRTPKNGSGFLCDDQVTRIPPSDLCNGAPNCPSGADEDQHMCSDLPNNLPDNLVFHCGNPHFWIFTDQKCNFINNCGDCSDEIGMCTFFYAPYSHNSQFFVHYCLVTILCFWVDSSCPSCGAEWWACTPVDYQYCDCIPRSLCQDSRQHCFDWSDEYMCIKG
ncbi:low-density lipoprotein receptor class A domain-containing protein 1-like [Paramisgurnus dabryanus]|uniref:low-density lipoprotein receptor class A domain-containing protein 1-like n=1 Tax=Paramisgurnus dabryanus TaxID=90735 RepID=UPI0031F384BA